jgi:hypothetical protein
MNQLERVIEAIEKHMRVLDRQARKCSKNGDHVWSAHYMARVMGLLDARNLCLEEVKRSEDYQRNSSSST